MEADPTHISVKRTTTSRMTVGNRSAPACNLTKQRYLVRCPETCMRNVTRLRVPTGAPQPPSGTRFRTRIRILGRPGIRIRATDSRTGSAGGRSKGELQRTVKEVDRFMRAGLLQEPAREEVTVPELNDGMTIELVSHGCIQFIARFSGRTRKSLTDYSAAFVVQRVVDRRTPE